MENTLKQIDNLYAELSGLLPMKPEYQKALDKKFRLEFNYNSNHIEGNTLTYGETELLLIFDKTTGSHDLREFEEMKAHDVALKMIQEWAEETNRPLTETSIKNLNEIILVKPYWKDAITPDGQNTKRKIKVGDYKEYPNSVRLSNGEIFEYASVTETPILMGELVEWYRNEEEKKKLHPVVLSALLHYKFVRVHPFDDGNGRVARLLMNYVLFKYGYPPVIIKSSDKKKYLTALNHADSGEINAFVEYIAKQLIWSLELSIKAAKGEDIEEENDIVKEISILNNRLSQESKPKKHPSEIYKIFTHVKNDVWTAIENTLAQFQVLFAENKVSHYVNYSPETFEKRNVLDTPFIISKEPRKYKIFGLDIHEDDIQHIEWKYTFFGLKGANSKPDLEVTVSVEFQLDIYYITVKTGIGHFSVHKSKHYYGELLKESEIETIQKKLAKKLIETIKERTNNND